MPKIQDTKMPGKYGNKSSFSRDKKYAVSSADIEHNAENVNKYKEMRDEERRHNLEVANGQDATSRPTQEPKARPPEPKARLQDSKSRSQEPKASDKSLAKVYPEPMAKVYPEPMAKPEPKSIIRCECGTPGLFAWFSPEGEKLILCDECYADRE
uniref:Uncharacterized protein n=1 Tax=viral metagenome TaxID=1070528 RepID=A0A6C0B556_9ZZZZ